MVRFYLQKALLLAICLLNVGCAITYHDVKHLPTYTESNHPKKIEVALVLSGAGSKAISHAGVIAALEKHNIPIDLIVGTSAGSIVGLFYADSKDINAVKKALLDTSRKNIIDNSTTYTFVSSMVFNTATKLKKFEEYLEKNVKSRKFEDLKLPLLVVTTDVDSGNRVLYNSGPVIPAVLASSSIPGIFEPVKMKDIILIDGAVAAPVPVLHAKKLNPKIIIAVNATSPLDGEAINTSTSLLYRAYSISYYELAKIEASFADVIITPDISRFNWLHDLHIQDKEALFQEGFAAGERAIKEIKLKLSKARLHG